MSSSSRLAPARRRARFLEVASAGAAVAGYGVLGFSSGVTGTVSPAAETTAA